MQMKRSFLAVLFGLFFLLLISVFTTRAYPEQNGTDEFNSAVRDAILRFSGNDFAPSFIQSPEFQVLFTMIEARGRFSDAERQSLREWLGMRVWEDPRLKIYRDWIVQEVWGDAVAHSLRSGSLTPESLRSMTTDDIAEDFQVNTNAGKCQKGEAAVAVDLNTGRFMMVWEDSRNVDDDVYCQLYSSGGSRIGGNIRVNDDDGIRSQNDPAVAAGPDGHFYVVWSDTRGSSSTLYGQKFDHEGNRIGANTALTPSDESRESGPSIGIAGDGTVLVAWTDYVPPIWNVHACRFDSDWTPLGDEFAVNDDGGQEGNPNKLYVDVSVNSAGTAVITWWDYRGNASNVYGQRYVPNGNAAGANFRISDTSGVLEPYVDLDDAGRFVSVWDSYLVDGIVIQRYDNLGNRSGSNVVMDTDGWYPNVIMDNDNSGRFTLIWSDDGMIKGQRFDANGQTTGSVFDVHSADITHQYYYTPQIVWEASGGYVVAFNGSTSSVIKDVYGQRLYSSGTRKGASFSATDDEGSGDQSNPRIGINEEGRFVVVWEDWRSGSDGIYARRYLADGTPLGTDFRIEDFENSYDGLSVGVEGSGAFQVAYCYIADVYVRRYDANGISMGEPLVLDEPYSQVDFSHAVNEDGLFVVAWIRNTGSNRDVYCQMFDADGEALSDPVVANENTGDTYRSAPSCAIDGSGDVVVVWDDGRNGYSCIFGQRYDSGGLPVGEDFQINDDVSSGGTTLHRESDPKVAMSGSGHCAVAWKHYGDGMILMDTDFYFQLYDEDGDPVGSNIQLNEVPRIYRGRAEDISISMGEYGNSIVVWRDERNDEDDIYGQRVAVDGTLLGSNFRVDLDDGLYEQAKPDVAMNAGQIVTVWEDSRMPGQGWDIFANIIDTGMDQAADPVFDPAPGVYDTGQSVTITCNTEGAEIRYTTDGEEPTLSDNLYTEAITVSSTMTLTAKAFKSGWISSSVVEGEYIILGQERIDGWIVGQPGRIYHTPDGGVNWLEQKSHMDGVVYSVFMNDDLKGFAVGDDQTILSTTDGGEAWSIQSGGSELFAKVDFIDSQTGWIFGFSGTILRTTDGGQNWFDPVSASSEEFVANITDGTFIDSNKGWLTCTIAVYKTVDGGTIWSSYMMPNLQAYGNAIVSIDFSSENTGLTVGSGGVIVHTSDGGESWWWQTSGTSAYLNDVLMIDDQTAWAVGDGVVLKTTDGGANWGSPLSFVSREILDYNLKSIFFYDSEKGWAVGNRNVGGESGIENWEAAVFKTTDGGVNWSRQVTFPGVILWDLNFPTESVEDLIPPYTEGHDPAKDEVNVTPGTSVSLHIKDDVRGVNRNSIVMTVNEEAIMPAITGNDADYLVVYDPVADFNYGETVTVTVDASDLAGNAMDQEFYSFTIEEAVYTDPGWVVGHEGYILYTPDGGSNWVRQESGVEDDLMDVYFLDASTGWGLGDGILLQTTNGGTAWSVRLDDVYLRSMTFIDDRTGWIVGGDPYVLKTTDGGMTWISPVSATSEMVNEVVRDVDFIDEQTGWFVAYDDTYDECVWKTTDGGANWEVQYSHSSPNLRHLAFIDENTGFIVGDNGFIMKTANGGITWQPITNLTEEDLSDPFFIDNSTGWIPGDWMMLKTTDGGQNWFNPVGFGEDVLDYEIESIHFIDTMTGWAACNEYIGYQEGKSVYETAIFKTTDGGIHWTLQESGTSSYRLNSVFFPVTVLQDGTPPYTEGHDPGKNATDVALNTDITVHVKDDTSGVDQSSIVMKVDGSVVSPAITGTPADYTLTYDPPSDFNYNQTVTVSIDAADLAGNAMATENYTFLTQRSADVIPPEITISGSVTGTVDSEMTVCADVTDNTMIESAVLYYRRGGERVYRSVSMTDAGGAQYAGTVPAESVTERGVEYYITAADTAGNEATSPEENAAASPHVVQVSFSSLDCPYATPANSYRMISVPVELNDKQPASILPDDLGNHDRAEWRLIRDESGTYAEYGLASISRFEPGNGYWLITKTSKNWDVGSGVSSNTGGSVAITLQPDWNQIGCPFAFSVAWDDVVKNGNVEPPVGYEGTGNDASGYRYSQSVLTPWKGYYVKNLESSPVTIEIPPVEAATSGRMKSGYVSQCHQEEDWMIRIRVDAGRATDWDNFAGCLSDANDDWDHHDFSEAPPFGEYVSLSFQHDEWQKYPGHYGGDIRATSSEGHVWDFEVRSNLEGEKVVLTFEGLESVPQGFDAMLVDCGLEVLKRLGEGETYTTVLFSEKAPKHFRLIVGTEAFADEASAEIAALPSEYRLLQNYPNPFNANTAIGYWLPEDASVEVRVYDSMGKEVRRLTCEEAVSSGHHVVIWDGRDQRGRDVSSGIYVCTFRAGGIRRSMKMLLVR